MHNYVLDGQGFGPVGEAFNVRNRYTGKFDPNLLRPFIETDPNSPDNGRPCANIQTGKMLYDADKKAFFPEMKKYRIDYLQSQGINSPVFNSVIFTRDDWIEIDRARQRVPRQNLRAWADLRNANTRGGFNAWTKMTLEYSASTDAGEAVKDMDATAPGRDDTPTHLIRSVPLPVIHFDFSYPQRLLDVARAAGMPLDTEMFEQGERRFWEMVERTLIGTETGMTWGARTTGPFPQTGTSTEWGYTNFPYRVTKTDLTTPTGSNPEAVKTDVQEMIETMHTNGYNGPFVLYHSTQYSSVFADDYFRTGGTAANTTVRQRIMDLGDIADIRRLNYLTSGHQLILVDLGSGQFQAINGMEPRTVQWSERGGYVQKFMLLGIQVPLLRSPTSGISALIHATTS